MSRQHGDPGSAPQRLGTATPFRHLRASDRETPKRKVLVAEDSPVVRLYLRHTLEHAGMGLEVYEAEDGLDAASSLERENFDLFICDLNLPQVDGRQVCALIAEKRKRRPFPILVFSSDRHAAQEVLAKQDPGIVFLQKPASAADIIAKVTALLAIPK